MAALAAVHIVLGILYESYIHLITLLSAPPSAKRPVLTLPVFQDPV
jgi:multidrug efflux pump subunit AcrB